MIKKNNILLAFYGDDFTGSTDALESMVRAGANAVLFIEPPSPEQLSHYPGLDVLGVAGDSRTMTPAQMQEQLPSLFGKLNALAPRHVHYKTCSTFDSSPQVGSIGKAIDIATEIFKNRFIPLLVAVPALGRYCLFGNLFARMGIGSEGAIFRLDRHPSMKNHPVTPATESDLRLHLAQQTSKKTALLDILQIRNSFESVNKALQQLINDDNPDLVLMDALEQEQLTTLGKLIDENRGEPTQFSVGSSGIEMALGQYWNSNGTLSMKAIPQARNVKQLLVVSGSCSPVTAGQVDYAKRNGFAELILDGNLIMNNDDDYIHASIREAQQLLNKKQSLIIHSNGNAQRHDNITAARLGFVLGSIGKELVPTLSIPRLVVAGGDTSSYAARTMGIESVQLIATLVPGAPLCRATAPDSPIDGIEISFKGGQVGAPDYFLRALHGN